MENIKETRLLLTEVTFTNLCKSGFIVFNVFLGKTDLYFTKLDIIELANGGIVSKDFTDEVVKIALNDIGTTVIREILKRSPIYSELSDLI